MKLNLTLGVFLFAGSLSAQTQMDSLMSKHASSMNPETFELLRYWQELNAANDGQTGFSDQNVRYKELVKAPRDGCYYGIGDERNSYLPYGLGKEECIECEENGGQLKANQSYIWSLTQGNGNLYYGTNTNYLCNTISEINKNGSGMIPVLPPYENRCWACEYGESQTGKGDDLFGDWHRPRIYHYDIATQTNQDVTPDDSDVLPYTYGLRSAGTLGEVSFIAGPNKADGISIFAYNNKENKFIGALNMLSLPGFSGKVPYNIRRWVVANNTLYCGVEYRREDNSKRGAILKWTGTPENPLSFEVVGWTKGGAAELVFLNNRIYVGTWPAAVAQSPVMEGECFEKTEDYTEASEWPTIFNYGTHYDPDMIQGAVASNGGMCVYNGQIYFGTLHMTWGNHFMISNLYRFEQDDMQSMLKAWLGSYRAAAMFRLTDFPGKEGAESYKVELLYGEEKLPAYDFVTKKWALKPTKMGAPLYGHSGFNNMFNNYIWSMSVLNDKLYIGTMDYTNLIVPQIESLEQYMGVSFPPYLVPMLYAMMSSNKQMGFNLMSIDGPDSKARLLNHTGFGNEASFGIRNMVTVGDKIFMGTASPLNLHETGGWQLFEVSQGAPLAAPSLNWSPETMTYGEDLSDGQLNAKAVHNAQPIPGEYHYSIQQRPVDQVQTLKPGNYNLRVEFVPEDADNYAVQSKKTTLKVNKAELKVAAQDREIDLGESLPTEFAVTMDGFKYEDNVQTLEKAPKASAETANAEVAGTYPIVVAGGESSRYNFTYQNGTLTVRVPTLIDKNQDQNLRFYPVPFRDQINLKSELQVLKVAFASLTGDIVLEIANPGSSVDVSSLIPGTYVLSITTANGTISRKVVKTN